MQVVRVLLAVILAGVPLARADRTHADSPAGSRHEAPPKPTSEIARDAGMVALMHVTQKESLVPILKSWKLLAGAEVAPRDRAGNVGLGLQTYRFKEVFVSALTRGSEGKSLASSLSSRYSVSNGVESGDFSKVALIFDTRPLDRRDYWANVGWIYRGAFHEGSFLPGAMKEFTETIATETGTVSNEIMFPRELSLDHLKEIWVHPRLRDEVITLLREAGIQPRDGRTLEEIVVGRTRMDFDRKGSEPEVITL